MRRGGKGNDAALDEIGLRCHEGRAAQNRTIVDREKAAAAKAKAAQAKLGHPYAFGFSGMDGLGSERLRWFSDACSIRNSY